MSCTDNEKPPELTERAEELRRLAECRRYAGRPAGPGDKVLICVDTCDTCDGRGIVDTGARFLRRWRKNKVCPTCLGEGVVEHLLRVSDLNRADDLRGVIGQTAVNLRKNLLGRICRAFDAAQEDLEKAA